MRKVIHFLAGALGGIAFVLACGSNGDRMSAGGDAHAQPSGCAVWEVAELNPGSLPSFDVPLVGGMASAWEIPAGWEPFGAESVRFQVRRCKP